MMQSDDTKTKVELESNLFRLSSSRKQLDALQNEIEQCCAILQREMGDDENIPGYIRTGCGPGHLTRAQVLINLRLRLSALKLQFLTPPHQPYCCGPFPPKKEDFDLKVLPHRQNNLYNQLLQEEAEVLMREKNPVVVLEERLKEMKFKFKATRYREENLRKSIESVNTKLEAAKIQMQNNSAVLEYTINHQNLIKMLLNPETFEIDPMLLTLGKTDPKSELEVCDYYKYKTLFTKSNNEIELFKEDILEVAKTLDATTTHYFEAEVLNIRNLADFKILQSNPDSKKKKPKKKAKSKKKKSGESDENLILKKANLQEETEQLRQFFLNPAVSNYENFKLFLLCIQRQKEEFLRLCEEII